MSLRALMLLTGPLPFPCYRRSTCTKGAPWTPWTKWRKLWRELRRAVRGAQLHVAAVPTIVPHSLLQAIMALLVPRLGSTACCASVVYSVGLTLLLLWHPAGADGHALALNRPCPRLTYCCA